MFFRLFLLTIALIIATTNCFGAKNSTQSGNWSNASTWDNGVPICGDTIYINSGHTVTVNTNVDFSSCGIPTFIIVEGVLEFKTGRRIFLSSGSTVLIKGIGLLEKGNGGGSSNLITIGGVVVWSAAEGNIDETTAVLLGEPFFEKIISVTNGRWENPSSWNCNCVPEFFHCVTIDIPHTINISSKTEINDLSINGILEASLLNDTIGINGNWLNTGSFVQGNSTVNFKGENTQQISGNSDFNNVSINNTNGGVIISSGNVNIIRTLTLTEGNLSTNNALTLISDANGTANIAEITGGSISGDVTMQRYIDAGATNWRFLSSAIFGTTLADFNDDFITSGFTGSDYPLWPTAASPWQSIFFYDESTTGTREDGFTPASNITNAVDPGIGLWIWSGDTISGTQPFTIDISGPINSGNLNLPVTFTNTGDTEGDGWNMLGNPYPSAIDWDDPSIVKTGIDNAIYIWNPDLQQYASYIGGLGTNGGSNNIASSQAFWVKSNSASPSILLTEACKTSDDIPFLKQAPKKTLTINLVNNNGFDQTIINFEPQATSNFDPIYDAAKLESVNTYLPSISTIGSDSTELSINQLPPNETTIPLKTTTGTTGFHTIELQGITNLKEDYSCILIEDILQGITYHIDNDTSFSVFLYDTTSVAQFRIKFGPTITTSSNIPSCHGNNDGQIYIENSSVNAYNVIWKNDQNNTIANNTNTIGLDSINHLIAGTYSMEISNQTCGTIIKSVRLTEPSAISSIFIPNNDTTSLSSGGLVNFTNLSDNATYYLWNFGDSITSSTTNPSHNYQQEGNYVVTLRALNNPNCFVENLS